MPIGMDDDLLELQDQHHHKILGMEADIDADERLTKKQRRGAANDASHDQAVQLVIAVAESPFWAAGRRALLRFATREE